MPLECQSDATQLEVQWDATWLLIWCHLTANEMPLSWHSHDIFHSHSTWLHIWGHWTSNLIPLDFIEIPHECQSDDSQSDANLMSLGCHLIANLCHLTLNHRLIDLKIKLI